MKKQCLEYLLLSWGLKIPQPFFIPLKYEDNTYINL